MVAQPSELEAESARSVAQVDPHETAVGSLLCYENHDMGLYFIAAPDDYWIEILPAE